MTSRLIESRCSPNNSFIHLQMALNRKKVPTQFKRTGWLKLHYDVCCDITSDVSFYVLPLLSHVIPGRQLKLKVCCRIGFNSLDVNTYMVEYDGKGNSSFLAFGE